MKLLGTTPRRGYALIEMLLVMTGVLVLFGISIGTIHMLIRLDRGNRARLGESATIGRLARQFRLDAHAASEARRTDPERLALTLPRGRKVEYGNDGGRLLRVEEGGGEPRREAFRMPSREGATFELREAEGHRWAVMVLGPNPGAKDITPPRPIVVEAAVGKDERLSRREEAKR